ncbi:DNA-binding protein [Lysinibacillus alkalisoli]|uniref:DNA-binding protein n=1 Tax=Lysinibacillus alkalisoli TaxID=1911548 RepID=A0A917FYU3_9BACI|nr:DNA-binding protein [Lysinibacillus alkalisoli]GGG14554.1 DNA-binding protein [Lysinibacillus alkalisoli]
MKIPNKFIAIITMLLCVNIVSVSTTYAEGLDDPAPEIVPTQPNGQSVLFDNMHAQTAGQADWVIDGAFSDFAEGIASRGYYVTELRKTTPFTWQDLQNYDVFIIPEANIPFKKSEQDAMIAYVENGGSIFFISDHYNADRNKNRWDSSEVMNGYRRGAYTDPTKGMSVSEKNSNAMQGIASTDWLSDNFGIRFRYNALGDIKTTAVVNAQDTFNITTGVSTVTMHAGSTLAITNPQQAKGIVHMPNGLTTTHKWGPSVDQGVYHGGGIAEGAYAAIAKLGAGKAAFIGDSSPVEDATPKYRNEETGKIKKTYDGFTDADNGTLLLNMVDWLANQEDYQSFMETNISRDTVSPQLAIEEPLHSTEPQQEPWSNPLPTYRWYEATSFAAGSFGSSELPIAEPLYRLLHNAIMANHTTETVTVKIEGLQPNQMITDITLGAYITGGQQIAKVQNINGSWPTSYGYSTPFSMLANAQGVATKQINMQFNPNITGQANLRLRQNKNNVVTQAITISVAKQREAIQDKVAN